MVFGSSPLQELQEREPSLLVESYMGLHLNLIQRQPTASRVQQVMRTYFREYGVELTHEGSQAVLPWCRAQSSGAYPFRVTGSAPSGGARQRFVRS